MAQEFQCKQTGCSEKVSYEPDEVIALRLRESKRTSILKGSKTVYLKCPKGHTHPYNVGS
ncbi:MAG: hypothetical protein HY913_17250 [Desulfomonile tiedjei]|nr:hypothetical protein [Desulfomonile tiedjei]